MNSQQSFDVAIVGGGLAGGLASLALADAGFSCAIIDAAPPSQMQEASFDGRTTAISYASARLFRRLGIWDDIAPGAEPIRDIHVTDGRARSRFSKGAVSPLFLHFDSSELEACEPLGYIAKNVALRRAFYERIEQSDFITLFAPAIASKAKFSGDKSSLYLADGREIEAALIVAADGRNSPLRAEAGVKVNEWRYQQSGIVTTVAHERPHHGVAQEFFLPSGPFAILPMTPLEAAGAPGPYRSSLVWTENAEATAAFLNLPEAAFDAEIENRFGDYLGAVKAIGPRSSYPLAFLLAQSFIAPGLALIGDAAHAIHPIAGQGYNLAVKDIAALRDVMTQARALGLEIGSLNALQDYQKWRRFDSAMLALGTDLLNRLFSNDFPPLRLARDIGMSAVGKSKPLRQFFMRQAGADLGVLPSLMARER